MQSNDKSIYGLVGYPLGHSFSRDFFNKKFAREDINAEYLNFEINDISLFADIIKDNSNLRGLNVTIPYKQQVLQYLDEIDATAKTIGAVNVIKPLRDKAGSIVGLKGYNSDIIGFVNSLLPLLKPLHKKALVLGTGGASKAVAAGLRELGIDPVFVSRTPKDGQLSYDQLSAEIIADHKVIVNTTPLGMYPKVDTCPPIPYQYLSADHICYDLVYNPEITLFMKKGTEQGAATKNGLEMLHLQALAAWKIWNEE